MTPVTSFAGKTVALFGLGGSGLATVLALKEGGARVIACDDNPAKMAEAGAKGIETADLRDVDWSQFSSFILSPGVPLTHPEPHWSAKLAKAAGVEIIGDIELFCRERAKIAPNAPFIAITGTNGKSTTTALIAHILREAGRDVQMGGNIGTAILSLDPPSDSRIHVIECSSFQIDLAPSLAPTVGILLNISPDHIDRHGTMENYAAIKERLVKRATFAVIGIDDEYTRAIFDRMRTPTVTFSAVKADGARVYSAGSHDIRRNFGRERPVVASLKNANSLRGQHNAQNAAAAVAALSAFNIIDEQFQRSFDTFPGLPHRMEEVGRLGGAFFINDSKATNADSTEKALKSFDDIFWILGGKSKEGGIEPLKPYFPKIRRAYLIGAASDQFAGTLGAQVPHVLCGTLDKAVAQASSDAQSLGAHAVVLLSPACASYDQFPNYEIRGNHFRDLVRALPGIEAKGA